MQVGDGEALYRTPAHPFVATFLGRVNRLRRDAATHGRNELTLGSLALPCPAQALGRNTRNCWCDPKTSRSVLWPLAGGRRRWSGTVLGDRVQPTLSMLDQDNLQAGVDRDHPARLGETVGIRMQLERLIPCDRQS